MRVAILSLNARPADAVGNALAEKAAALLDRHADLRVFLEDTSDVQPFLRPYTRRIDPRQLQPAARRWLASADLILVEVTQHARILELLPWLARQRGRIVIDDHGQTPAALAPAAAQAAVARGEAWRAAAAVADVAVVHSRFVRDELTATGLPAERVSVVGFPVEAPPADAERARRFRAKHAPEGAKVLLFVGRLAPNKRLPLLVRALAAVQDAGTPVHAWVVGDATGCYAAEWQKAHGLALDLGIGDKLHLLGRLSDADLADAYASADCLAMPSVHEGFGIPVREAQAAGLPVVAAQATALPEVVASAGLTFPADDATAFADQLRRVLFPADVRPVEGRRVAVVMTRCDDHATSGAERSLVLMAEALAERGYAVDVHTLADRPGVRPEAWGTVYQYPADARDEARLADALAALERGSADDVEATVVRHLPAAAGLIDGIAARGPYKAVIAGPALSALTLRVAQAFPDRTVIAPCFHDEPAARLPKFLAAYRGVAGMVYHSPEEKLFAEQTLGVQVPGAVVAGTVLRNASAKRRVSRTPYLLFCGRQIAEKRVDDLVAWCERYEREHPGRVELVLAGEPGVALPAAPWCRSLGVVDEPTKADLLANALATVTLSRRESLSLVTLEGWQHGTPAIVAADGGVMQGHIDRSGGGFAVGGYEAFAAAIDTLLTNPADRGERGRRYVAERYEGPAFADALVAAVEACDRTLPERMRLAGLALAEQHGRPHWRAAFEAVVERALHAPPRVEGGIEVVPVAATFGVAFGQREAWLPVTLTLHGSGVAVPDGVARTELVAQAVDADGQPLGDECVTPLPAVLVSGRGLPAAVRVTLDHHAETVRVWARSFAGPGSDAADESLPAVVALDSAATSPAVPRSLCPVQKLLADAMATVAAPAPYREPAAGRAGQLKAWVKGKLLNSFQRLYVEPLAARQESFNRRMVEAARALADEQMRLAGRPTAERFAEEVAALRAEVARLRERVHAGSEARPPLRLVAPHDAARRLP